MAEREKIYMVHLKPVKLEPLVSRDFSFRRSARFVSFVAIPRGNLKQEDIAKRMAALTPGFAGADIANVCNEDRLPTRSQQAAESLIFGHAAVVDSLALLHTNHRLW